MAKFPILRAPERLGVVPTTAVRADLDVRTGGQELAQAGIGLGGAIAELGLKWYAMEADTQLSEAKTQAEQEHVRLMLELPGLEPWEHSIAYGKSLKTRQGFLPKNRMAANTYGRLLNESSPQWGLDVENVTKAKLKDNMRATGFVTQQGAMRTGDFAEYFTHLAKGKILGVYDAEEVVKYKQATIDGRERYVKLQTAQQLEQLEVQREINRDEISKLIRAGKSADMAIEESDLDEKEQFSWFERQRAETERRLKGVPIIVNQEEKRRLGDLIPDIWRGRITIDNVSKEINEARWPSDGSAPKIDDNVFDSLTSKARTELKAVQNESISDMIQDVSSELQFKEQSAMMIFLSTIEDKDERTRVIDENQVRAARVNLFEEMIYDFLKDNPKAQRDEFEEFKRETFPHIRKWEPGMLMPLIGPERIEEERKRKKADIEAYLESVRKAAGGVQFSFSLDKLNRVYKNLPTEEKKGAFRRAWERAKKAEATEEEFLEEWNK